MTCVAWSLTMCCPCRITTSVASARIYDERRERMCEEFYQYLSDHWDLKRVQEIVGAFGDAPATAGVSACVQIELVLDNATPG